MGKTIAIVDDEADILELISLHMRKAGFTTHGFTDAKSFLRYLDKQIPSLIILDLMLPDIDGLEVCREVRSRGKTSMVPILMLTAKGEETDKVVGLELGADDYMTKPFSPKELVARARAILRRYQRKETTNKIEINERLTLDLEKYELICEGKKIELTTTEFKILEFLCSRRGWVFSRDKILDYLWGQEKAVIDRTIDVHVRHLRQKLGKAGNLIQNVRGIGYKLSEE